MQGFGGKNTYTALKYYLNNKEVSKVEKRQSERENNNVICERKMLSIH